MTSVIIKLVDIYDRKSKIYKKLQALIKPIQKVLKEPSYTWEELGKFLGKSHVWNIFSDKGFIPLIDLLIEVNRELTYYDIGEKRMISVEGELAAFGNTRITDEYSRLKNFIREEQEYLIKWLRPTLFEIASNENYKEDWKLVLQQFDDFIKDVGKGLAILLFILEELDKLGHLDLQADAVTDSRQHVKKKFIEALEANNFNSAKNWVVAARKSAIFGPEDLHLMRILVYYVEIKDIDKLQALIKSRMFLEIFDKEDEQEAIKKIAEKLESEVERIETKVEIVRIQPDAAADLDKGLNEGEGIPFTSTEGNVLSKDILVFARITNGVPPFNVICYLQKIERKLGTTVIGKSDVKRVLEKDKDELLYVNIDNILKKAYKDNIPEFAYFNVIVAAVSERNKKTNFDRKVIRINAALYQILTLTPINSRRITRGKKSVVRQPMTPIEVIGKYHEEIRDEFEIGKGKELEIVLIDSPLKDEIQVVITFDKDTNKFSIMKHMMSPQTIIKIKGILFEEAAAWLNSGEEIEINGYKFNVAITTTDKIPSLGEYTDRFPIILTTRYSRREPEPIYDNIIGALNEGWGTYGIGKLKLIDGSEVMGERAALYPGVDDSVLIEGANSVDVDTIQEVRGRNNELLWRRKQIVGEEIPVYEDLNKALREGLDKTNRHGKLLLVDSSKVSVNSSAWIPDPVIEVPVIGRNPVNINDIAEVRDINGTLLWHRQLTIKIKSPLPNSVHYIGEYIDDLEVIATGLGSEEINAGVEGIDFYWGLVFKRGGIQEGAMIHYNRTGPHNEQSTTIPNDADEAPTELFIAIVDIRVEPIKKLAEIKIPIMLKRRRFFIEWGIAENQGKRPEMEDFHHFEPRFMGKENAFFAGVYDGHGGSFGSYTASLLLHEKFKGHFERTNDIKTSFTQAYKDISDEINKNTPQSGTTAANVLIFGNELYTAHVGDSKVVICVDDKPIHVTEDHTPYNQKEHYRVIKEGGAVRPDQYNVLRLNGIAMFTRALGDKNVGAGVSSLPDITKLFLSNLVKLGSTIRIIICCDGIFERNIMNVEEAARIASSYNDPNDSAKALVTEAFSRGSYDNLTAMVIKLTPTARVEQRSAEAAVVETTTPEGEGEGPPIPIPPEITDPDEAFAYGRQKIKESLKKIPWFGSREHAIRSGVILWNEATKVSRAFYGGFRKRYDKGDPIKLIEEAPRQFAEEIVEEVERQIQQENLARRETLARREAQIINESYNWVLENVPFEDLRFETIARKLKEGGIGVMQVKMDMDPDFLAKIFPDTHYKYSLVHSNYGELVLMVGSTLRYVGPNPGFNFDLELKEGLKWLFNVERDRKNTYVHKLIKPAVGKLQKISENIWEFERTEKGEIQFSDKPLRSRQTETSQPTRLRINFDAINPDDIIPKDLTGSREIFEAVIQDIKTIITDSEFGLDIPESRNWAIMDVNRLLLQAQRTQYFHLEKALGIKGRVSNEEFMGRTLLFAETIVDAIRGDAKAQQKLNEAISRVK